MSDAEKKQLIEIVGHLSPTKVIQLLEFARQLDSSRKMDPSAVRDAILKTRGKYKDVLSTTEEFAQRKRSELELEDR